MLDLLVGMCCVICPHCFMSVIDNVTIVFTVHGEELWQGSVSYSNETSSLPCNPNQQDVVLCWS